MTEESEAPAGDLAQFIEETLTQIVEGIVAAQLRVDGLGAQINPAGNITSSAERRAVRIADNRLAYLETVAFDVAITRSEGHSGGAGGGIRVMGIGVGGNVESSDANTRVSRISFSVPVVFPGDPNHQAEAEMKAQSERLQQSRRRTSNWVTQW